MEIDIQPMDAETLDKMKASMAAPYVTMLRDTALQIEGHRQRAIDDNRLEAKIAWRTLWKASGGRSYAYHIEVMWMDRIIVF